ncbi:unnamed protein product [Caenorhabditis auriculariae]|uniref:RNA helicase n=1 Tax=Caenorhabditis auriculariae TaxID=2777116 RepID=A0A8S1H3Z5_9PELO|nr:unnamed protein product [Caenorhabditis auriculariae]
MSSYHPGHGNRERGGRAGHTDRRQFRRPDEAADKPRTGPLVLEERQAETSTGTTTESLAVFNNPYASLNIQQQRIRLPIFKNRSHILYMLERYRTVIIVGETGCGKSTQVPQFLLEAGWAKDGRQIAITQPRRVAVVTLATRVAEEKDCLLGHDVGYTVRFDDVSDTSTKIKFMTDGILLRELLVDPLLAKV